METFPATFLFNLIGIHPIKYSRVTKKYKICRFRAIVCSLVLLLIFLLNIYRGFVNICNLRMLMKINKNLNSLGKMTQQIDQLTWVVTHGVSMVSVFVQRKRFCRLMNLLNSIVQKLLLYNFIKEPDVSNTKIFYNILVACLYISTFIYCGIRWAKIDSFVHSMFIAFFGIHFPVIKMYEYVFIEKSRYYLKMLIQNLNPECHQRLYFWLEIRKKLWKLSKMSWKCFVVTKTVNILGVVVIMSAYWFSNYDNRDIFVSLAWEMTMLPTFVLCYTWSKLDKQVSGF